MNADVLILFILAGLITYAIRAIFMVPSLSKKVNVYFSMMLDHVPSAAFAALVFPSVFFLQSGESLTISWVQIGAGLMALLASYFSKNLAAAILAGMVSLWFFKWLF